MKKCNGCGKEFTPEVGQNAVKYCPKCAKTLGKTRKRFCVICGKLIVSSYARYCCDECKKEARRRADKALREQLEEEKAMLILPKKEKPKVSLKDMCTEAAAHGMSYGKYVEWLEREERKA